MGLANVLVLSQVSTYILTLLLSLCIVIPISFHLHDFKGHCLLFSNGTWRETDGQLVVDWSSCGFCVYNISWASVAFVVSLAQIYRCISHLCHGSDSSFLSAFVDTVVSILMVFASLAGAMIVTVGYQTWCNAIMRRFEACEDATINDIDRDDGIDTAMFYMQFGTAQFGAWTSWACWVGVCTFSLLKLCKYHQQENIRVSMARERARLIGESRGSLAE